MRTINKDLRKAKGLFAFFAFCTLVSIPLFIKGRPTDYSLISWTHISWYVIFVSILICCSIAITTLYFIHELLPKVKEKRKLKSLFN